MEPSSRDEPPAKRQKMEEEKKEDDEKASFRFSVGEQVLCNTSKRASGYLWKVGTVTQVAYRPPVEQTQNKKVVYEDDDGSLVIAYVVQLEDGSKVAAPEDDDECVRLAARCSDDTRIMRQLAVSEEKRKDTCLGFTEGNRVSVQLDVGIWEEGVIVEAWAIPERNGRRLKTWAGVCVPYAVSLDLGGIVFVPFDTDEVIRPENAALPPQKSIAEQIGGTDRSGPPVRKSSESSDRFVVCQNAAGDWVRRDSRTGFERSCAPPSPEEC